jgi:hypothetical protein
MIMGAEDQDSREDNIVIRVMRRRRDPAKTGEVVGIGDKSSAVQRSFSRRGGAKIPSGRFWYRQSCPIQSWGNQPELVKADILKWRRSGVQGKTES